MTKKITIEITRYNPESQKFGTDSYKIDTHPDMTVLEALHNINSQFNAGLSYRYACGMGICGSCGAMVNDKPILLCKTFCRNLQQPIRVAPMKNFPIIKDLVVDIDNAMEKLRTVMPYTDFMLNKKNVRQTKKQRKKIDQTSQCIKCMLCYAACPIYGFNNDFIGPAAASTAYRYTLDNRVDDKEKRLNNLIGKNGIWECTHVGECSVVCPKNVDPNGALVKLKLRGAIQTAKNIIRKK